MKNSDPPIQEPNDLPEPTDSHLNGRRTVTILIPLFNESEMMPILRQRLEDFSATNPDVLWQFLFVDDGSSDDTMAQVKAFATDDERVTYVSLSRNFGKEAAMLAGFDHVTTDAVVIIDADLQDPPELIPAMVALWRQGFDDVYAKRRSRPGESWLKRTTSKLYYRVLQRSTHVPIQVDSGDFRLLDRACIDALTATREGQRNTKALFSWIGYRKTEILFDRDERQAGTTKWRYRQLVELALDGITSFTTAPLRFATAAGAIISGLAFLYMLFLIIRTVFFFSDMGGYPSMMSVILFLGGIQLLSIGIIGEYVGRIFNETKRRPPYLVQETNSTSRAKEAGPDS